MSETSPAVQVPDGFDPVPSIGRLAALGVDVAPSAPGDAPLGVLVAADGDVPAELGLDRATLESAGFSGKAGQVLVVPRPGAAPLVAAGIGPADAATPAAVRDAAGHVARAVRAVEQVAVVVPSLALDDEAVAQVLVEGAVLARYDYDVLKAEPAGPRLTGVTLVAAGERGDALEAGARRGLVLAAAGQLARDLANAPPAHLTATAMAAVATRIAERDGLGIELFHRDQLVEMGCGGLLGVNGGSAEPPVLVKLTYTPASPNGAHLSLVGKAITYDSGGISLKPGDAVHATMKNDMSGGGAVLAAMSALTAIGCPTAVTAFVCCTDNMPSGTALKMGDVITIRGGTTVEVLNTDAEGRLIMADALVLATETPTDAIIDIATLTGACMRALGTDVAGVMGNDAGLVDQVRSAAALTDEPVWELPLEPRYRKEIISPIADLKNLGGPNGGAIHAGLFLAEFVGDRPWAHIDIAGTAQGTADESWRTSGCTGFGARLLVELAVDFSAPGA